MFGLDWGELGFCLAVTVGGGLGLYLPICLAFELHHRLRGPEAAAWKLQPDRWQSPRLRKEEVLFGVANMVLASVVSGFLLYFIRAGGPTALYFEIDAFGIPYTIAATVLYFLITDFSLYWAHRLFHRPWLYKKIHRVHHRFRTPSAFTATAVHPVEMLTFQAVALLPIFLLPLHPISVIVVLIYQHFVSLIDHCGARVNSHLPWQAPAAFHDDHHVYFHVNFAQTMSLWDRVFGTWRRGALVYGEKSFVQDQDRKNEPLSYAPAAVEARALARLEKKNRKPMKRNTPARRVESVGV